MLLFLPLVLFESATIEERSLKQASLVIGKLDEKQLLIYQLLFPGIETNFPQMAFMITKRNDQMSRDLQLVYKNATNIII